MAAPLRYDDPYWSDLSAKTEGKLGLPSGLLHAVVNKGERSNADQVSEAGAKTPYQIIPSTRDAIIKKYGIDPYLSPENSAEAAGLLLKESLDRNKGNISKAVAEYHGGTNPSNWGAKTADYVRRVTGDQPSSFDNAIAEREQKQESGIADALAAYRSGRMSAEDSAQFEKHVNDGTIMLPKDQKLKPTEASNAQLLPQAVTEAYVSDQLSPQDRAQLEDYMNQGLVKLPASQVAKIPTEKPAPIEQSIIQEKPQPTLGERLKGLAETGLSAATGATTGAMGFGIGAIKGVGEEIAQGKLGTGHAEQVAGETASKFTYQPKTEQGQKYTEQLADIAAPLQALPGMSGEIAAIGQASKLAAPVARASGEISLNAVKQAAIQTGEKIVSAADKGNEAIRTAPAKIKQLLGIEEAPAARQAQESAGSAATPQAVVREKTSQNLPVPVDLTLGEKTREANQLAFEKEQLKSEIGAPLREKAERSNQQITQNFDALFDKTGAESANPLETGQRTVDVLNKGYKQAKGIVNAAYKKARESDEAQAKIDPAQKVTIGDGDNQITSSLVDMFNDTPSGLSTTGLMDHAKQYAQRLGIVSKADDGSFQPLKTTVAKMEELRKEINDATGYEPQQIRQATILKKVIDAKTEPVAGPLFKEARALRANMARKYEGRAVVSRLLTNKRGTEDPKVAIEDVFNKSIVNGSNDEVTFIKRVLSTHGEEGKQAWRDLQGSTVDYIKNNSLSNQTDSAGNEIISGAKLANTIKKLDANGKLDVILGKEKAAIIRDLNEVMSYINTVPPGTLINNSGTAGTMLRVISEAGVTGTLTGLPLPVLSAFKAIRQQIKSNKIKAKINHSINAKLTSSEGK